GGVVEGRSLAQQVSRGPGHRLRRRKQERRHAEELDVALPGCHEHHRDRHGGDSRDPALSIAHAAASMACRRSEAMAWNSGDACRSRLRGRGKATSVTPTTRPGLGDSDTTLSPRNTASAMLWVTRSVARRLA